MKDIKVVIAGRDKDALEELAKVTGPQLDCEPILQHIDNGHADPLHGHTDLPDLLILDLAADWREQLGAICARPTQARPTMLVVGPATQVDAMRLSMRAGAKDYLASPVDSEELEQALALITLEERRGHQSTCRWTSVIGSRGGVGASMIACNLAQLLQAEARTALIDLHLQAGSLASYLDLEPRNNFHDAIEAIAELDNIALDGLMTRTDNGLRLLAAPSTLVLPEQIPDESLEGLFSLLSQNFEHVIVDLPRHLDHVVAAAIEQSDDFLLVMEQSVATLRETLRLTEILNEEFGVNEASMRVIVNRYSRTAAVTESHIRKNLGDIEILTVANDYKSVSESLDIGVPVVTHARSSAASKSLLAVQEKLTGKRRQRSSFVSSLTNMLRS